MSSKRALVVDDSKSARAFLARILERHEIVVDAAESAEAAIDYLSRNKPDVIFMDHLMPGMDGFQAVQSIKNNPRTSAIPILMYTSQEGDLYLGQARALGAEGVLPKQIKQSDVTKMLFQLRLVADRRDGDRQPTLMRMAQGLDQNPALVPANESAIVVTPPAEAIVMPAEVAAEGAEISRLLPQMSLEIRAALDASLQREIGALRGFVASSLEAHTERLHGDIAAVLPAPAPAPRIDTPTLVPERRPRAAIAGWTLAVLALAGGGFVSWQWWQQGAEIAALRTDLNAAYTEVETLRASPVVSAAPAAQPGADTASAAETAVSAGTASGDIVASTAISPAADAPDAATVSSNEVQLVPAVPATATAAAPAAPNPAAQAQ